jgi:cell wall-associated NlpC family hydrolase
MGGTFDRFVGIPYLDKGRSLVGCDCWGLLHQVYRELRGIDLPSYAEDYVTASDRREIARLISGELGAWEKVEPGFEVTFDGVLMSEDGFLRHVGVVTTPGLLLHVQRGQTSRIERYRSGLLARRVAGIFRYKGDA